MLVQTDPYNPALLPWRLSWALFNRLGWLRRPDVGASPHLPANAVLRWREAISQSKVYLEYGSGGSTVEAAKSVPTVISVDTDARYLAVVKQRVTDGARGTNFHPVAVDIGWTQQWGRPLFRAQTPERLAKWRNYTAAPWNVLDELGRSPDFIFIDGRFRAASALESMLRLSEESNCTFMFDDFDGRQDTHGAVLKFACDVERVDRAIVFRRNSDFDRSECERLLRKYQTDPE